MIPKRIKICPFVYKIKYPDLGLGSDSEYVGLIDQSRLLIRLSEEDGGDIRPNSKVIETLLHESLHGIDAIFCGNVMSEDLIQSLTMAWFSVLFDNNLMLQTNKIPGKVKVGGIIYKVKYPYEMDDCTTASRCNNATCTILLGNHRGRNKSDIKYIQLHLVLSLMSAVIHSFNLSYLCEDLPETTLLTFSNGLYQVLRDNDWRGWME